MKLIPRKSNGFAKRRKLKREERICELCYAGVEDEMHFMWDCEAYDRRSGRLLSDLEAEVEPWVLAHFMLILILKGRDRCTSCSL